MKIKTFALAAFMTLAVTSAFAQPATTTPAETPSWRQNGMMAPSMDDQDYSAWKPVFKMLYNTPVGASSSIKKAMMMMEGMEFKDEYDARVYAYMIRLAMPEHRRPLREFDTNVSRVSFDTTFMRVQLQLNAYRRELIAEDEARGKSNMMMMGKPMMAPRSGM